MTIPVKKFGSYYTGQILGHRVYAKLKWQDPWELKEHVMCESATWSAAPSMGSATLYYRYGPGVFPGVEPGDWLAKFDLPTLAFVRIDFDVARLPDDEEMEANPTIVTRKWYGVVGTLVEAFSGSDVQLTTDDGSGGTQPIYIIQGKQTLNAVGLEWLLDRQYVNRSWYQLGDGLLVNEARRGWAFNMVGPEISRNASREDVEAPNGTFTKIFNYSDRQDLFGSSKYWTTTGIIKYLLGWHMGRNQAGSVNMPWKLNDLYDLLRNDQTERPSFGPDIHGTTVWQLLNQLVARQRGYSFYLTVSGDTLTDSEAAEVQLIPFTLTAEDIQLPFEIVVAGSGKFEPATIKANPHQYAIDLTNDRTAGPIVVTKDAFSEYDQVEVYGARAVHCTSISGGWISRNYTAQQELDYESGGSGESGYPTGEVAEMQRWHAEYRNRPALQDVYRHFVLETPLDTTVFDNPVFPADYDDPVNNPDGNGRDLPLEELVIWDKVPLVAGVDYTDQESFESSSVSGLFGSEFIPLESRQLLEPAIYFEIDNKWYAGDKISVSQDVESPTEDDNFQFSVRVLPNSKLPGHFYLDVYGQPQHVIARGDFDPQPDDKVVGGVNYYDSWITLAFLADYHCTARWPEKLSEDPDYNPDATLRVRMINAGEAYQFHLVLDGTTFGVEDDLRLEVGDKPIIVRDDRDKLKEIARMAFLWYGKPRRSLQFSTQWITDAFEVGDMITGMIVDRNGNPFEVDDYIGEEINTCITSITIRNQVGGENQPPPSVEYKTEFSELDVISYFT